MHFIVYNCIRRLMLEAAEQQKILPRRISVKGSIQTLRQWQPLLNKADLTPSERRRLVALLYETIAKSTLFDRPGRSEPRCVKRRPKPFRLMTAPRHVLREASL